MDFGASMGISMLVGFAVGFIIGGSIFAVFHILKAIPLYRVAKELGCGNPVLAWLPFGQDYLTGKIGDELRQRNGQKPFKMGILALVAALFYVPYFASLLMMMIPMGPMMTGEAGPSLLVVVIIGGLLFAISWLLIMAGHVIQYTATYGIFKHYAPKNAVLYLVLAILLTGPGIMLMVATHKKPEQA